MKKILESVGGFFIGIISLAALGLVLGFFIRGGAWVAVKVYPWLSLAFTLALAITIVVLIPLSIFKRTKGIASTGMLIASYVFGLSLWVWGFLLTYTIWGAGALILGLFLFGVGVVPIAMLAALVKGLWPTLIQLVVLVVMTFGTRLWAMRLAMRADELAYEGYQHEDGFTSDFYRDHRSIEEEYEELDNEQEGFPEVDDDEYEEEFEEEYTLEVVEKEEKEQYSPDVVESECPGCGKLWKLNVFRYSTSPFECPTCGTEYRLTK